MKSKQYLIVAFAVLAVLFSVFMFYFTETITPAWVIAYICILLDIGVLAVATLTGDAKHMYLRLGTLSVLYLCAGGSALFNLIVMLSAEYWRTSLVVILNLLIIGIGAILYLIPAAHNAAVIEEEQVIAKKYAFILEDRNKLRDCMGLISDFHLKKEVERVYDAIANAVVDGNADSSVLEAEIDRKCDLLYNACANQEEAEIRRLCPLLLNDIRKRELILKSKGF